MINAGNDVSLLGYVVKDMSGNIFLSTHIPSMQIVSHEDAQQIVEALVGFYATHGTEEVALHNISAEKKWSSETYAKHPAD